MYQEGVFMYLKDCLPITTLSVYTSEFSGVRTGFSF